MTCGLGNGQRGATCRKPMPVGVGTALSKATRACPDASPRRHTGLPRRQPPEAHGPAQTPAPGGTRACPDASPPEAHGLAQPSALPEGTPGCPGCSPAGGAPACPDLGAAGGRARPPKRSSCARSQDPRWRCRCAAAGAKAAGHLPIRKRASEQRGECERTWIELPSARRAISPSHRRSAGGGGPSSSERPMHAKIPQPIHPLT